MSRSQHFMAADAGAPEDENGARRPGDLAGLQCYKACTKWSGTEVQ